MNYVSEENDELRTENQLKDQQLRWMRSTLQSAYQRKRHGAQQLREEIISIRNEKDQQLCRP